MAVHRAFQCFDYAIEPVHKNKQSLLVIRKTHTWEYIKRDRCLCLVESEAK